jgi:transposase-like protein
MEKGRVGNKRKKVEKSKEIKSVPCKRCKAKAMLVKTIGKHEVYKCSKCNRTTERWL